MRWARFFLAQLAGAAYRGRMNHRTRIVLAVIAVLAVGALAWWAWGPHARGSRMLSGYVEGEALYLSSATAGPLSAVSVSADRTCTARSHLPWARCSSASIRLASISRGASASSAPSSLSASASWR